MWIADLKYVDSAQIIEKNPNYFTSVAFLKRDTIIV